MAPPDDRNLPSWLKPPAPKTFDLDAVTFDTTSADTNNDTSAEATDVPDVAAPTEPALSMSSGAADDMVIPSRPLDDSALDLQVEVDHPTLRSRLVKWLAGALQVILIFVFMLVASLVAGFLFGYLGLGF